ncbi:hypothetical protein [Achromobacter spanius]|uniref:Uncharacterized protein n=1 Tax=Achromobacter spanius TaxID=217203 RepID=A0AA42LV70_9BURK|nr:hypothetical protein [Achromobacter spanius]MDH0740189.1 hypothetical protein [Achromobacter spanius]
MKQSEMNHLRQLLGWVIATFDDATPPSAAAAKLETYAARLSFAMSLRGVGVSALSKTTGMSYQGVKRATEGRSKAFSAANNSRAALVLGISPEWLATGEGDVSLRVSTMPAHIREAVKALEKLLSAPGREPGVEGPRASVETRTSIGFDPGVVGGRERPLSDFAMEQGLAEVGITVWGPRAQDWAAGAEYALRLMRQSITPAATELLPSRLNAAGDTVACRDMQAAPPALRRDEASCVDATPRGPEETASYVLIKKLAANLGNRDWKWWDSNSFRRLTFEDGQDRRDGSALHGTMQASDGHPDVNMAAGVREFIEAASPFAIGKLCNALAEKDRDLQGMRAVLTDLINECERNDVQAAGEVQRLFIHPHVVELARRALGGHAEATTC